MLTHTGYLKVYKPIFLLLPIFLLIFSSVAAYADATIPDRRKDQFPSSDAHLIVPLPYSYPGIGGGFFLMGNFSNLRDTTTDFLAMVITGDAGGYILQFDEVPIVNQHLFLKLYYQDIDRAQVNQYDVRGMNGTSKNDFTLLDVTLARSKTAELNLTFFDRRLNFLYQHMDQEFEPANSYRLFLNENGKLRWEVQTDAGIEIHTHDPGASIWRRMAARILSWLPIEKEL